MTPEDLYELMRCVPSTRQFTDEPVERETIVRVLDSARFAPSGGNRQGWRVIVLTDPATRRTLRELYVPRWDDYMEATGMRGALNAGEASGLPPGRLRMAAARRRLCAVIRPRPAAPGHLRRDHRAGDNGHQPAPDEHHRRRVDLSVRPEHPARAASGRSWRVVHDAAGPRGARGPRAAEDPGERRAGGAHLGRAPSRPLAVEADTQSGRRVRVRRALWGALVALPQCV